MHDIRIIAHRGLLQGPDSFKENNPKFIENSLVMGYDCEIDLWVVQGKYYLGHDEPRYEVPESFLERWKSNLFVHCKNFDCLKSMPTDMNYFWHENDEFTITSKGQIWAYYKREIAAEGTIVVMPEVVGTKLVKEIFGICTDWPDLYRRKYMEI